MTNALYTKKKKYNDIPYTSKFYQLDDWKELPRIDQVQAVCFLNKNQIVFYKNIKGFLGNPGGGPKKNETPKQTLKRELIEEAQLKLLNWATIGYEKLDYIKNDEVFKTQYFLRAIAKVELIDAKIKDPDGKGIKRIVVDTNDATKILNWGKEGEILIELALKNYTKIFK